MREKERERECVFVCLCVRVCACACVARGCRYVATCVKVRKYVYVYERVYLRVMQCMREGICKYCMLI